MSVSIHARKSEAGLTGGKSIRSKSVLIKRRKGVVNLLDPSQY